MPIPNAHEMARLQSDYASWATEDAQLVHPTKQSDGAGGYTESDQVIWSGKVSRRPQSESRRATLEAPAGDLDQAKAYYLFALPVLPPGTVVKHVDRLIVGSRTYLIEGMLDRSQQIATYVLATETT